jgi:nucleoside-triphosphatase
MTHPAPLCSLPLRSSSVKAKNILLTGPPQCGKSTLIEKLIHHIDKPLTGFFTRELRERGQRVGFSITTLARKQGTLAHEKSQSQIRIGKYGVNIDDIDQVAVPSMVPSKPDEIVVIDEIGKMECRSPLFRKTLLDILNCQHQVIGTIAQKGDPFIQKIKERGDVLLVPVSEQNRDSLVSFLEASIR